MAKTRNSWPLWRVSSQAMRSTLQAPAGPGARDRPGCRIGVPHQVEHTGAPPRSRARASSFSGARRSSRRHGFLGHTAQGELIRGPRLSKISRTRHGDGIRPP